MIRIIKSGRKIEKKWIGTCRLCGCEVECDKKDLNVTVFGAYYLECPQCNRCYIGMEEKEADVNTPVPPKGGTGVKNRK